MVDTFGTGVIPQDEIVKRIKGVFNLKPASIIQTLDLLRPIYRLTSAYGHFGRNDREFTWEYTDKAAQLK